MISPLGLHERTFTRERRYWNFGLQIVRTKRVTALNRLFQFKLGQDDLMRDALDQISHLLAAFFADTEYVLSDIFAGLLLLVHSPEKPPPPEQQEQRTDEPEWMRRPQVFAFTSRMINFAVAIYGWPTYLLNNRSCSQLCGLLQQTRCLNNCRFKFARSFKHLQT